MKILAMGASASKASINKQFAAYAAAQFEHATVKLLDLNDYEVPLFSVDIEKQQGIPPLIREFVGEFEEATFIIISLAEHNGSYTAAFKNIFDWASRLEIKLFGGKKVLLLATSTGQGGGKSVLESAVKRFPKHGADIAGEFSLPRFFDNFSPEKGITDEQLRQDFDLLMNIIKGTVGQA
ncbi:MAG TPA: NAD(P)H-dependent oxidoreductase [Prolixibacteraceae bacterium]|nr:NAD(P)H-dependent oxidoreductase [Prolixibacteraceae bacterium]HRV90524.1 NAD(P)H-dependent oxidoreductase [Prolixibacteraceae bacterium]